jgi:hypothetical protein
MKAQEVRRLRSKDGSGGANGCFAVQAPPCKKPIAYNKSESQHRWFRDSQMASSRRHYTSLYHCYCLDLLELALELATRGGHDKYLSAGPSHKTYNQGCRSSSERNDEDKNREGKTAVFRAQNHIDRI